MTIGHLGPSPGLKNEWLMRVPYMLGRWLKGNSERPLHLTRISATLLSAKEVDKPIWFMNQRLKWCTSDRLALTDFERQNNREKSIKSHQKWLFDKVYDRILIRNPNASFVQDELKEIINPIAISYSIGIRKFSHTSDLSCDYGKVRLNECGSSNHLLKSYE